MSKQRFCKRLYRLICVVMVLVMIITNFTVNTYAGESDWYDVVKERVMEAQKEGFVYVNDLNIPIDEYYDVVDVVEELAGGADGFWLEDCGVYQSSGCVYCINIYIKDKYINADGTINKVQAKEDYNNNVYRAQNGEAAQVIKEMMASMESGYKAFVVSDFKIPATEGKSVLLQLNKLLVVDRDYYWVDLINVINEGGYVKEFRVWSKDEFTVNYEIDKELARAEFDDLSEDVSVGRIEEALRKKFDKAVANMEAGYGVNVYVDDIMFLANMTFAEVNAVAKNLLNSVEYCIIATYGTHSPCPIIQRYYYYLVPGDYFDADGNVDRMAAIEGYYRYDLMWQELSVLLSSDMSELEKVLLVHEWVVRECEYDYSRYLAGTLTKEVYEVEGVVENGLAVCQGYSYALRHFLNRAGIENGVVTSTAMNHMWNYVRIDGEIYFIDSTWDDYGKDDDMEGNMFHRCFLKSGEEFVQLEHQEWDYPGVSANDSNSYEGYIFREDATYGKNNMSYYDGYWYYLTSDYQISKAKIDGTDKSVFATYDEKIVNAYIYGDYMYVATQTKVYKVDMSGTYNSEIIYDITKTQLGSVIEEFVLKNRQLKIDSGNNTEYIDVAVKEYNVIMSESKLELEVNKTAKLDLKANYNYSSDVVWISLDNSVLSVSDDGTVSANSVGVATVVAVVNGNIVTCEVTVRNAFRYGDMNGDEDVNILDAVAIKKHLAGYSDTGINTDAGDVNADGVVDILDAVMLMKYLAGYDISLGA